MKKKSKAVVIGLLICIALAALLPLPVRINRTLEGIRWKNGQEQTAEECTVTVSGWYYRYLFRNNVFKGDIQISGVEGTDPANGFLLDMEMGRNSLFRRQTGYMPYYVKSKNAVQSMGTLVISGNFKEVLWLEPVYSESDDAGWLVSAPAETRKGAVELGNKLTNGLIDYQ